MIAEARRLTVALSALYWNMLGGGLKVFTTFHTSRNHPKYCGHSHVINKHHEIVGSENWNRNDGIIVLA